MRVGLYGAMAANCSRVQVHRLGQSKEGRELLDVGVYQNRHWKVKLKTVSPALACARMGPGHAVTLGPMQRRLRGRKRHWKVKLKTVRRCGQGFQTCARWHRVLSGRPGAGTGRSSYRR